MATREVGLPALPGAPGGKAWACTVTASWDELDAWLASALCAAQRGSPGTQASKRKRTAAHFLSRPPPTRATTRAP